MKKINIVLVASCFIFIAGCANKNIANTPIDPLILQQNPEFEQIANSNGWVNDEYRKYQASKGFKAFAYMMDDKVLATGWSDDEKSKDEALQEAIRMCRHYGNNAAPCTIVDYQPLK